MPSYCFRRPSGEPIEQVMSIKEFSAAQRGDKYDIGGELCDIDYVAQHGKHKHVFGATWPRLSVGMGCLPHEIEAKSKMLAAAGEPTEFDKSGDMILRDQGHANRVMQKTGVFDRDACYGQHAGRR